MNQKNGFATYCYDEETVKIIGNIFDNLKIHLNKTN